MKDPRKQRPPLAHLCASANEDVFQPCRTAAIRWVLRGRVSARLNSEPPLNLNSLKPLRQPQKLSAGLRLFCLRTATHSCERVKRIDWPVNTRSLCTTEN